MEEQSTATSKVRVQFSSRDAELQLPSGTGAILLSTDLKRYALSTLINNLLETETPVPFEFLINGLFLRTSIEDYLSAHGLSTESTLNVEFVKALVPPTHSSSLEHDDWVSSLDIYSANENGVPWMVSTVGLRESERILTGSYDGLLRMWTASSRQVATSQSTSMTAVSQAVKAVQFINHSSVVSGGDDRVVRIWRYAEAGEQPQAGHPGSFSPSLELYGHQSSVEGIAVHEKSARILSASTDHSVGVWSTRKSELPAAPESLLPIPSLKRRKTQQAVAGNTVAQRGPLRMLKGHSGPVTGVKFSAKDATVAYSCSWDHAIVTWDLVTGAEVSSRRTMHPLLCITELAELGVLVVGSTARHLSVVDPRADVRDISGMTLRGHIGAVASVAPEPGHPWGLISGSHDGTCKIWDLRSVNTSHTAAGVAGAGQVCESVYSIARDSAPRSAKISPGESSKVFAIQWHKDVGIVSAGEDKRVQINRPIVK